MLPPNLQIDDAALVPIAQKILAAERLSFEDGVTLYESHDLLAIGYLAHHVRVRMHGMRTYFNVNRHINPTNVCVASCKLCAFGRKPEVPGATSARSWKSWRRSTRWRWRSGFNGATSARSWKWSEVGACGLLWFGLQWGHERALVEISTTNSWSRSTSALQWGHERALVEIHNSDGWQGVFGELQWGHERALVEMKSGGLHEPDSHRLQWGHERALVEIGRRSRALAHRPGFNGATSARSWKYGGEYPGD